MPRAPADEIDQLFDALASSDVAIRNSSHQSLAQSAKTAPARIAKKLAVLEEISRTASESSTIEAVLGIFVSLCNASNSYHRKLASAFADALARAGATDLVRWSQMILPILKGEPYANVRAIVEARLPQLPETEGKALATFLNVRWRPAR